MKKANSPAIISPQNTLNQLLNLDINKKPLKIKSKKPEVRIVYFGTPDFSALVLEKLIEFCQNPTSHIGGVILNDDVNPPAFTLQAVITQPDKPVGRKQILSASPVAQLAQRNNIPTLKPHKLDEEFIKNHLSFLDCDLIVLAAYGKIIPQEVLDIPKYGALNIHPSCLPKYRGASPIQNAILNGDKTTCLSIIQMDEKMDHGPVIYTKEFTLAYNDNFQTLSTKLFSEAAESLPKIVVDFISGKINPQLQNDAEATFTKLIKKEDGYFDLNNPPALEKLDRMIRAYYPWPNAWTKWEGKIVKFYPENLVQMEGKKPVKLEEFLRGYPDFSLKQLV